MKHIKTVDIPASKKEMVDFTTCDFCGERLKRVSYYVNEVTITSRTGESYPEGATITEKSVDMCVDCFNIHFTKFCEEHNVKITITDVSW
jgi:hypothetical protein